MKLTTIKSALDEQRQALNKRMGARDQLVQTRQAEIELADQALHQANVADQAYQFIIAFIMKHRKHAVDTIAHLGTISLQMVYDSNYYLKFDTHESRAKDGQADFKMEMKIGSKQGGNDLLTGIRYERGGGLAEVAAFNLRESVLEWLGYEGPLLIDEAYSSMSNDAKIHRVARYLRRLVDNTGRQTFFVTHDVEVFAPLADQRLHITNVDGFAHVREVGTEELMDIVRLESQPPVANDFDLEFVNE